MPVYRYDLDGFTTIPSPFPDLVEGEPEMEWPDFLERQGWTLFTKYGGDWAIRAVLYRHVTGPNFYVEVFDDLAESYAVFVAFDAWPTFLRTELAPLMRLGVETETAHNIERLANAVITIARHGSGTRIDHWDGRSPSDKK